MRLGSILVSMDSTVTNTLILLAVILYLLAGSFIHDEPEPADREETIYEGKDLL